jgi:hypothetical protein
MYAYKRHNVKKKTVPVNHYIIFPPPEPHPLKKDAIASWFIARGEASGYIEAADRLSDMRNHQPNGRSI